MNPNRTDCVAPFRFDIGGSLAITKPAANLQSMIVGDMTVKLDLDFKESVDSLKEAVKNAIMSAHTEAQKPTTEEHTDCACKTQANVLESEGNNMDELKKQLDEATKALETVNAKVAALEIEVTSAKADTATLVANHAVAMEKSEGQAEIEKARADRLDAELTATKAAVEAAAAARNDAEETAFQACVDARVELLSIAAKFDLSDVKTKSNKDIKCEVVKKVRNKDVSDKTDAQIDAAYEVALELASEAETSITAVRETIQEHVQSAPKTDDKDDEAKARAAMDAATSTGWKR